MGIRLPIAPRHHTLVLPVTTVPRAGARESSVGWLPGLCLTGACGLLFVAVAGSGARDVQGWAEPVFWLGLALLFVPCAARLFASGAARRERIGVVTLLGLGLYLVKVLLHSPRSFTFYDELLHWRTTDDIVRSGHLFQPNPLLPVSPLYPALENVTHALSSIAGISIFAAGIIVIGAARVVFILALFFFYEQLGHSSWIGGVAALVYMANPYFVFFDAQFAYESLALPLAAITLYSVARRGRERDNRHRLGLTVVILLGLGATLTTHHLTSYALIALLGLWAMVGWLLPRLLKRANTLDRGLFWLVLVGLVANAAWLVYVAGVVVLPYLTPIFGSAIAEVLRLIAGEATSRELFRNPAGQTAPLWERLITYAAVLLVIGGLPFGLARVWRRYRADPGALTLGLVALVYPASHLLRLTASGQEVAGRMSGFLFAGVAFVLAVGADQARHRAARRGSVVATRSGIGARVQRKMPTIGTRGRRYGSVIAITLIFWGGTLTGWSPWMRLPGPYLVSADARSIEPQSLAAAEWVAPHLGTDNRIATDRINRLLMGSYGRQNVITNLSSRIDPAPVFFSPHFGPQELAIFQQAAVRYIVIDRRLSSGLPMVGVYFESGEPITNVRTGPISPAVLAKFDGLANVNRIFDSGDIVVYDLGVLTGAP